MRYIKTVHLTAATTTPAPSAPQLPACQAPRNRESQPTQTGSPPTHPPMLWSCRYSGAIALLPPQQNPTRQTANVKARQPTDVVVVQVLQGEHDGTDVEARQRLVQPPEHLDLRQSEREVDSYELTN